MKLFNIKELAFVIFLILLSATSKSQMRVMSQDLQKRAIKSISFFNTGGGYVCFEDKLAFTSDSGQNFVFKSINITNTNGYEIPANSTFIVNGAEAINKDTLFVYGLLASKPSILKSYDGAHTFEVVLHTSSRAHASAITDLKYNKSNQYLYAITNTQVFLSKDGGSVWEEKFYHDPIRGDGLFMNSIAFGLDSTMSVSAGFVYRSRYNVRSFNNGDSIGFDRFDPMEPPIGIFEYTQYINDSTAYTNLNENWYPGLKENTKLIKTVDTGKTWTDVALFDTVPSRKFHFVTAQKAYGFDTTNTVTITENGGLNWVPVKQDSLDVSDLVECFYFVDEHTFYTGGRNGVLKLYVAINYWLGTEDDNWHNPNNWSKREVPMETSIVKINANTSHNAVIKQNASCYNIEIQQGATLTVAAGVSFKITK